MGPIFDIEGGWIVSEDNPLGFNDKIAAVITFNLKYLNNAEILNNFVYHLLQNDSCQ